jgi:hypothetical protein
MITEEMFNQFKSVMASGTIDMQGVKAREASGLAGEDYNEILANFSAYSEKFSSADTKLEPEPIVEEPEVEETEEEEPEPEPEEPEEEVEED